MYPLAQGISGRVMDASDGTPIEAASVDVREADSTQFITTDSGEFSTGHLRRFFSPPRHEYLTLRISAHGYKRSDVKVAFDGDLDTDRREVTGLVIPLQPK
jgi:hypothetical protein